MLNNADQMMTRSADAASDTGDTATTTYVVDTSVLLSDPRAMIRFAEHQVVLPIVVITELEGKRHDPELGYFARSALQLLDDLRQTHGRLDRPIRVNGDGGVLHIELNHTGQDLLPAGPAGVTHQILAVALNHPAAKPRGGGQRDHRCGQGTAMGLEARSTAMTSRRHRWTGMVGCT